VRSLQARKHFDFNVRISDPLPPQFNQVLVEVKACGLCGTDLHFARDAAPDYMPLGHEISAEVVEVGQGNIPYRPGDKVIVEDVAQCGVCGECKSGRAHRCRNMYSLDGQSGMSEMLTVDYHLVNPFAGMPWEQATLAEPAAVAYNAVLNARIPLGGDVAILGPGPIGLMCIPLARMGGAARVALVGRAKSSSRGARRMAVGRELGADYTIQGGDEEVTRRLTDLFGKGADSVIVTSPPRSIPLALKLLKFGGTISFIGINLGGKSSVSLDFNELVFNKVALCATFAEPAQNFPDTIKLLGKGLIDATKLITHRFGFEEAAEFFKRCDQGDEPVVKAVFVPGEDR
jgi:threonine dehydrogenase-like Zn-dependent dehydrogenase